MNSKWLCETYLNKWRAQPDWSLSGFQQQVKDDFQCDVLKWKFYRARKWARKLLEDSVSEQYNQLWDYYEDVRKCNPGSTIKLQCEPQFDFTSEGNPKFLRLCCAWQLVRKTFWRLKAPFIGFDGYFVKGPRKGQLLATVRVDSNNPIYPIVFAIVESECYETWR